MAAVIMDSGKLWMLKTKTGQQSISLSNCKYHLYVNNVSPSHGDTLGTYTEATYTGYAAITAGGWSAPALDGTFHAMSTATLMTWANTSAGSVSIYGYFVTDNAGTTLLYAELFSGAPLTIPVGMSLQLTPTVTDQSEF